MSVRDLLRHKGKSLITVGPRAELAAAIRVLVSNDIGGLPVIGQDGVAVGFLSEKDVVRALHENHGTIQHLRVADVMKPAPSCDGDDTLEHAMRRMTGRHLRHLLVQENGHPVGVISVGDMVKHRLYELETEAGVLRDYVAAHRASR